MSETQSIAVGSYFVSGHEFNRAGLARVRSQVLQAAENAEIGCENGEANVAGAEAHIHSASILGPAKAVPLLQSLLQLSFSEVCFAPAVSWSPMTSRNPTRSRLSLWQIAAQIMLGLILGYIAYLPAIAISLKLQYGRVDPEHFYYSLYLPIQLPFLADPDFRETLKSSELILLLSGVILEGLGVYFMIRLRRKDVAVPSIR